jgi:hypothetical protein
MAISPLALGIGLQGKYDYKSQAALEIARSKGRAKAEADEEAGKEKKRAEIRKMISNIKPEGLLPFQQKIMDDGMADLLIYGADHQDDYPGMTQRTFQLIAKNKAFREQAEGYKRLSLQQGGMPVDAQALRVIGTLSDPNAIREELVKFGDATSVGLTGDQLILDNPKYEGLSTTFAKFVKDSMFDPQQEVKTFTIGDRKYGGAEINTEVPKIMTATIMNTDNLKRSALNDYLGHAIDQKIPYDFSTLEGREEFKNNTTKWVNDNAQAYVDSLSKQYGGSKTQFTTNVSTGVPESGMLGAPVETETVISTLTGKPGEQKSAKSLGLLPRFKDFEMTMPVTTTTIDATTSEVFSRGGDKNVKAKFNGADAYYVAKENIQIPGLKYRKGAIIDENDRAKLMRMGKLDVKFVVFGITDNDDEIYDSYDQAGVIPILGQSKTDAALIKQSLSDATTKFNQYKANLKQYQAAAPAAAPVKQSVVAKPPAATTKPKDNTGKVDANKSNAIDKANKASGGLITFKKK